ncbi:MAG: MATE family efflux transporter [Armatimonadetes bacterium]|nr:MATE family efflux transporter [Armatimonadota bacterium]MDE2207474.1 MATE family efflux transporter [Armatimonadota bacterium]
MQLPETKLQRVSPEERLHRVIWVLAWPVILTMMMQMVNSMMDALFVGHLPDSRAALAATGVGGQMIYILLALSMGVTVGATALVARSTGEGNHAAAARSAGQAISLAALAGVVFAAICFLLRFRFADLLLGGAANTESRRLCAQFLAMAMTGVPAMMVGSALIASFRGIGNTRTPMYIMCVVILVHTALSVVLIYGLLGFPALGVRGAGLGFAGSMIFEMLVYLAVTRSPGGIPAAVSAHNLRLTREWAWRILRIGIPASVQGVLRSVAMLLFTGMLAHTADGSAGVAALEIGMRAEAAAFMPGFGYRVSAATLVGQNLGAGNPRRAERCAYHALMQAVVLMTAVAICFFVFAKPFSSLFTTDPMVQRIGADYLRINAFCEPFLALGMVLMGAMQGAGETLIPTCITLFNMWFVRLPAAWLLMVAAGLQAHGAWLAMSGSTMVSGVATLLYFRTGRWKRQTV